MAGRVQNLIRALTESVRHVGEWISRPNILYNAIIWAYTLSCLLRFESLCLSISFSARVLRKVLHFLADIGDVCNDKLGLPYQKCTKLFQEGRENCMELLSVFSFLCHILDGFQSLCGLARGASLAYD